jgi:antitoxin component of RelBE/YafQ-DinJ toxin-antitoxin module
LTVATDTLTCLLAITRRADADAFDAPGFEPATRCRVLDLGTLAAVVTDVPTAQLVGDEAEQLLNDADWLAPRALAHDAAIRAAWALGPVMPLPFGVAFQTDDRLQHKLRAHAIAIEGFLNATAQHAEIPVRVHLDRETALSAIADARTAELGPDGDGAAYLLKRQARARAVDELDDYIDRHTAGLADILEEPATDAIEREPTRADEGVVRSWAFLVPIADAAAFDRALVSANDAARKAGFTLTAGQPLPPYSFCPALDDLG